jgi:Fur family ferric uptake transcriptional regulator
MDERAFRDFLKKKGLRFTKEREAIFSEVLRKKGHFDPEELHISLRERGIAVSRASVYRTLPLLIEAGVIEEVERTEKHAHYECTIGRSHHDHMLCLNCGRVIEFYSEELEKLQDRICGQMSFEGVSHNLEVKGYCRRCSKKLK